MPARPELSLRLPNSPGSLASVCRELAAERIQIHALSLDASGMLRLIVDNHHLRPHRIVRLALLGIECRTS